jgi:hypothetical protein
VDHVRVQERGSQTANRAQHVARQSRARVGAAAHALPRDVARLERVVEAARVLACIEREELRVDPALSQRGQQGEQVLLRAADPLHLDHVQDLHARMRR